MLDRRVLRRQAEGVPSHGVEHVEAAHPFVARDHVADGVVPHMAHVDPARRIGEHLEAVVLRLRSVLGHLEGLLLLPGPLPAFFNFLEIVPFVQTTPPDHCMVVPEPGRAVLLLTKCSMMIKRLCIQVEEFHTELESPLPLLCVRITSQSTRSRPVNDRKAAMQPVAGLQAPVGIEQHAGDADILGHPEKGSPSPLPFTDARSASGPPGDSGP